MNLKSMVALLLFANLDLVRFEGVPPEKVILIFYRM